MFRRKLWWAVMPAVVIGGLTASGLAWAQTSGSPPSGSAAPATPRVFFATSPTRILDTRIALGTATAGPLGANGKIDVQVAGVGPVPANATAAAVNVTVFGTDQQSFLTVWPSGEAQPGTSLLNPQPGLILSQAASIGLGGGKLSIYNAVGATQVIVDLVGYYQDTTDVPSLNGIAHFNTGPADPTPDQGVVGDVYVNNTTNTLFGPKTGGGWGTGIRLGGTVFTSGTADPAAGVGSPGDMYMNTATNTLFGPKSASGWGVGIRLGGAMFSSGAADPAAGAGAPGDMYINTATNTLFGPKTASGWGTGNPMGSHFTKGTTDPTAATGIVGDIYLNTATNVLFGPKTAAGWGTGASLLPAAQSFAGPNAYWGITPAPGWVAFAGAQITLPPGKWEIQAKANVALGPAQQVDYRIQDMTANAPVDSGTVYNGNANNASIPMGAIATLSLTTTTTYQLQVNEAAGGTASVGFVKFVATELASINGA